LSDAAPPAATVATTALPLSARKTEATTVSAFNNEHDAVGHEANEKHKPVVA